MLHRQEFQGDCPPEFPLHGYGGARKGEKIAEGREIRAKK
jgi:hypothetical protein